VPYRIELMKVVKHRDEEGQLGDYYLFRFQASPTDKRWLTGMTGPYPHNKIEAMSDAGMTFFEPWSESSVARLLRTTSLD
jgi:hypothetical protein